MPSITYRLLVRPPAQSGPRMVANPPTDRRTPWLNPAAWRGKGLFGNLLKVWKVLIYLKFN